MYILHCALGMLHCALFTYGTLLFTYVTVYSLHWSNRSISAPIVQKHHHGLQLGEEGVPLLHFATF